MSKKRKRKLKKQIREYNYRKKKKKVLERKKRERERIKKKRLRNRRLREQIQEKEQEKRRIEHEQQKEREQKRDQKETKRETQREIKRETKRETKKETQRKKPQRKVCQRRIWIKRAFAEVAALCLFLAVLYLFARPKITEELTVEAGSRFPDLSAFLLRNYKDANFARKWDEILDLNTVADYEIAIMISGKEYISVLHVVDTKAPAVVTKEVQIYKDHTLQPMDFIEEIEDATKTTVSFVKMPDFTVPGEQEVSLKVVDEGGNTSHISAKMEVLEDTVPPVIDGVEELTVAVGESISYKKNVAVSDNYDKNVTLTIDNSEVDLNTAGDYPVTYIAKDSAGNVTEETTTVHVKPPSVETATEEMVNKKADEILAQITTDDMSQYEVAKAIFNWVHTNVGWSDGTPKTNWIQGAYRGLFSRRGDCYVYASASKCLLTRAGIANMDIGFSTERRTHYWNLIDLGDGWYHFDATRRTDGRSFFYCTDEEIRAYSATHNGSHAYDPSMYPAIQ